VYWWRLWIDYVTTGVIGDGLRLVETILALIAVYAVWGPKPASFFSVKKKVSVVLLFEAIYFLLTLPIIFVEIFYLDTTPIFMLGLAIQILIAAPALIILASKIWHYTETDAPNVLKWAGIAAIAYLAGIWFNNVFRWFNTAQSAGIGFLPTGTSSLGFIGIVATLSASLIFAVAAFYAMFRKHTTKLAIKLSAVALILLSLNFVIYIIYSALTNTMSYVFLVEIWPITLLGLGLGMLRGKI